MKMITKNRKGMLYDFIVIVIFVLSFAVVYVGFDNFMKNMFPAMATTMNASTDTVTAITTLWNSIPYLAGLTVLMFAIFAITSKREGEGVQYY